MSEEKSFLSKYKMYSHTHTHRETISQMVHVYTQYMLSCTLKMKQNNKKDDGGDGSDDDHSNHRVETPCDDDDDDTP